MSEILHEIYLPFTKEQLCEHFAPVGIAPTDPDLHVRRFCESARAAREWEEHPASGTPAEVAKAKKHALQIQKDERFWVAAALMSLFHAPDPVRAFAGMLASCLGAVPPVEGLANWEQALGDGAELKLYFEVSLPTPPGYRRHLVGRLGERVLIPHVLESARKTAAAGHALEGATKADAVLVAPETGFAVLFEAKVLADASGGIGFDVLRNQIARSIDVMLEPNPRLQAADQTAAWADLLRAHHAGDLPPASRKPPVRLADARLPEQPRSPAARPSAPHGNGLRWSFQAAGMAYLGGMQTPRLLMIRQSAHLGRLRNASTPGR